MDHKKVVHRCFIQSTTLYTTLEIFLGTSSPIFFMTVIILLYLAKIPQNNSLYLTIISRHACKRICAEIRTPKYDLKILFVSPLS